MTKQPTETVMEGGCQCGLIRYRVVGALVDLYVCHCRECRKQSSSAFGISVMVKSSDLVRLSGAPRIWTRHASVAGTLDCAFCPRCGTRLWHGDPDRDPTVSIKGGSLDIPPDLSQAKHIWTSRKLQGILIPEGAEIHAEEPPG